MDRTFLDLLYADAPREAYDELLERLGEDAADQHALALQVRERMARHRGREAELSALYDTANDLTAIRDLDTILTAIVRRARQLLHADMTYLSLNDEADGASYMKVTDGALTPEFRELRLPLGTGLLGLVAQSGAPYFTEDYQSDERFVHQRVHRLGGRRREDPGHPRRPAGGGGPRDRRAARGAPHGAAVPARRGHPADLVRRARRGGAGERPAVRLRARGRGQRGPGEPAAAGPLGVRRAGRAVPRPAHRRAAARRRRGRDRRRARRGARRPRERVRRGVAAAGRRRRRAGRPDRGDRDGPAVRAQRRDRARDLRGGGRGRRGAPRHPGRARHPAGAGRAAHPGARRDRHRAGAAVQPHRGGGRGAGARRAAHRPAGRPRPRPRPAPRAGPPPGRRPRAARGGRGGPRRRRRAAPRGPPRSPPWPGSAAGCPRCTRAPSWWSRRARTPSSSAGPCVAGWPPTAPTVTVGVAAAAGGAADVPAGYVEARRCTDTLLALGRSGEVSDPAHLGLARLLLGTSGPGELDDFVVRGARPGAGYDRRAGDRAGRRRWRPGSTPAGRCAATAEVLHVHPNTVAPAAGADRRRCSATTGGSRPGRSTCSWRCGCTGCASGPDDEA